MSKTTINELEVNGEVYVKKSSIPDSYVETDHIIVIAQRGWIFEGYKDKSITDKIRLLNANVVRKWSNGRGIGGYAKPEYKSEYIVDSVGTVEFANEGIIATINCEW